VLLVLDPRISYEGLHEDYQDDPDLHAELEKSMVALRDHFLANYTTTGIDTTDPTPDPTVPNGSPQKISFTSRYGKKRHPTTTASELDEYF
jgi:hypothetical protein